MKEQDTLLNIVLDRFNSFLIVKIVLDKENRKSL